MPRLTLMSLFIFVLMLPSLIPGQNWEIVRQGEMELSPKDGFFYDDNHGWYISNNGAVVLTVDGGSNAQTVREPQSEVEKWNAIEFADLDTGYACGDNGIIYKSTDGGYSWQMVANTAQFSSDLHDLAVVTGDTVYFSGNNGTVLKTTDGGASYHAMDYAFLDEDLDGGIAFVNSRMGVVISDANDGHTWYTHDGGQSWRHVQLNFPYGTIASKLYDVAAGGDSTFAIAAYHYCLFISKDGGKTYTQRADYTYDFKRFTSVDVIDEKIILVGGQDGHIIMTHDGGSHWDTLRTGSGQSVKFLDFVDASTGYVFAQLGQWFKTVDGGDTWQPLLSWPNLPFLNLYLPADNRIVVTSEHGGELTFSTDGGWNWDYPNNFATGSSMNINECEFYNASDGIIAGTNGELYRTDDGGLTWNFADNPMYQNSRHIQALGYVNDQTVLAGGRYGMLMKSEDGGENWALIGNQGGNAINDLFIVGDSIAFAAADNEQLYFSAGQLDSFEIWIDRDGDTAMNALDIHGDNGIVVSSKGHIYRFSPNDTETFEEVFSDTEARAFHDVEFVDDSTIYVVGDSPYLYRSIDAGSSWKMLETSLEAGLNKIRYRNNHLWAVGNDGVILHGNLQSDAALVNVFINEFMADNGNVISDTSGEYDDWIELYNANDVAVEVGGLFISDDLSDPFGYQIPGDQSDATTIAPGGFLLLWADNDSEQGLTHLELRLDKEGEQLALVQSIDGQPHFIDSLSFSSQEMNRSYGRASDGTSTWAYFNPASPGESNAKGTPVSIDQRLPVIVLDYELSQNYPNPFNPKTNITFTIKKPGHVTLEVYNLRGQKIETLVDRRLQAGTFETIWNAGAYASGVYFYRLQAGNYSKQKKMILVK